METEIQSSSMESPSNKQERPFRVIQKIKLHVTESFLSSLKDKFTFVYSPIEVKGLHCMAVATDTNEIIFRDIETGDDIRKFPSGHKYSIKRLACWESGSKGHLISLSSDSIRSRDLEGRHVRVFTGHKSRLTCCVLSDDEELGDVKLVSGSWDGTILVHSLKTAKILFSLEKHTAPITSLCFAFGIGDIPLIVSVDLHQSIAMWGQEDGSLMRLLAP